MVTWSTSAQLPAWALAGLLCLLAALGVAVAALLRQRQQVRVRHAAQRPAAPAMLQGEAVGQALDARGGPL